MHDPLTAGAASAAPPWRPLAFTRWRSGSVAHGVTSFVRRLREMCFASTGLVPGATFPDPAQELGAAGTPGAGRLFDSTR